MVGNGEDVTGEKAEAAARRNRILTAVALGLVAAATIVVLIAFFIYTKRAREGVLGDALAANTISTPSRLYGASINCD